MEEQLEAEQYFTTLYKTQVNELTDEVDDSKERDRENQNDKEALVLQIKSLVARADNDARYVFFLNAFFVQKRQLEQRHRIEKEISFKLTNPAQLKP